MKKHPPPTVDPRIVRSRHAILGAATELFLRQGYTAATMDEIADLAAVSKRTVYNNFPDKDTLFREVVLGATNRADRFVAEAAAALAEPEDLQATLTDLAIRLATIVTSPAVVQLRRLIIGEAHRFPDLATDYFHQAPGKVLAMLAAAFEDLGSRGRLLIGNPELAAEQFAYLTIGSALDRALFDSRAANRPGDEELVAAAAAGVTTFLAAHGARPT